MPEKIIQQLISGQYIDEGKVISVPVKSVRIDEGISDYALDLIAECDLSGKALVVSDVNTKAVLGDKIIKLLGAESLVFENGVRPDAGNVEKIKDAAKSVDYIVAVGSGTINDLCKYASFLLGKHYVIFGTAPSMNGYGSANSSIIISGHKKTLKAHLPKGIFLDLEILAKAPSRLIRSGFGDSICRSTAQADWLLSHLLLGTYYNDLPFRLLAGNIEHELLENVSGLVRGDAQSIRLLAYNLVLSGFGMYIAGGSYPASQGEHMIAHTMEMACGSDLPDSYHGEQIAVTTLTMAKLQEDILGRVSLSALPSCLQPDIGNAEFTGLLGAQTAQECLAEYKAKQFGAERLEQINQNLSAQWGKVSQQISKIMLPYNTIYNSLKLAGCPLTPQSIGWQDGQYNNAVKFAKYSRNRFTFLDLVGKA